jgi:deoxyribodipyrimidine photolyase-related protein
MARVRVGPVLATDAGVAVDERPGREATSPAGFLGGGTQMRCVAEVVDGIEQRAWVHIQRLVVLGNLAMLAGISPQQMARWMAEAFIDGAEWVMLPNVIGIAMWADGGRMATKPYAAGGAYINRMSDYCRSCPYEPTKRTGPTACPFTTLYWDFLARNADRLASNHRMQQPLRGLQRLPDVVAVRARASEVLSRLDAGEL